MNGGAGSHPRRPGVITIVALVAGVLLLSALGKCQAGRWLAERDAAIEVADSLRIVTREDSALAAAWRDSANTERVRRQSDSVALERAVAEADRLRALRRRVVPVASQPGAAPTVSDSLAARDSALVLCDEETVVLRAALDTNRAIVASAERQIGHLEAALTLEIAAAASLRPEVARLSDLLARADPPCSVLWWSCPSRTVMAIGGVVLGAGFTFVVTRR